MVAAETREAIEIVQSETLQRTLRESVIITGRTLHTGEWAEIVIDPAPENYGIRFCHYESRAGKGESLFVCAGDSTSSAIINGGRILCIEHMMSSLHGLGITNAHIRCVKGSEVPIGDGSAENLVAKIVEAGWVEQRVPTLCFAVKGIIRQVDASEHRLIVAHPWHGFRVDALIDFPQPIGKQSYSIEVTPGTYLREIAPARTFLQQSIDVTSLSKVRDMRLLGLEVGRLDECQVILYDNANYFSALRFSTEAVRHKVLDFIGDIYTLGLPIRGRFQIIRPGHGFTLKFCHLLSSILASGGKIPKEERSHDVGKRLARVLCPGRPEARS